MREIKFRAWDPVIKSFHFSDDISEWRQICFGGAGDDVGIGIKLHYSIKNWDRWGDGKTQRSVKELIWMQYTGLKDKNGKEIYEGDVVYLAGYGNYICEFPFIELYESSFEGDIGAIIGNIYENPDLLK